MIADRIDCLFGRRAPHFGLRTGAKAQGYLGAHLDDALGSRHGERLCIGISDDKFDALQPGRDHVVDGIAASTADPKHDNARLHLANIGDACHFCLTISPASWESEDIGCYLRALRSAATKSAARWPSRRAASPWVSIEPPARPPVRSAATSPSSRALISLAATISAVA